MSASVIDLLDYKKILSKLDKLEEDNDIISFAKWTTKNVKENFLVKRGE
tara:strand:+ start:1705 stop:1851 length:147 start_codon:yes stop_codon:yes gene_type:complete